MLNMAERSGEAFGQQETAVFAVLGQRILLEGFSTVSLQHGFVEGLFVERGLSHSWETAVLLSLVFALGVVINIYLRFRCNGNEAWRGLDRIAYVGWVSLMGSLRGHGVVIFINDWFRRLALSVVNGTAVVSFVLQDGLVKTCFGSRVPNGGFIVGVGVVTIVVIVQA